MSTKRYNSLAGSAIKHSRAASLPRQNNRGEALVLLYITSYRAVSTDCPELVTGAGHV